MSISKNIKDHRDIGLNADYCVSVYPIKGYLVFDNEDDTYSVGKHFPEADNSDDEFPTYFDGTFSECVEWIEEVTK